MDCDTLEDKRPPQFWPPAFGGDTRCAAKVTTTADEHLHAWRRGAKVRVRGGDRGVWTRRCCPAQLNAPDIITQHVSLPASDAAAGHPCQTANRKSLTGVVHRLQP